MTNNIQTYTAAELSRKHPLDTSQAILPITWEQIIRIEPRMLTLYTLATSVRDDKQRFCANAIWYDVLKPFLSKHVGWAARLESLRSSEAYDIVYEKLYAALPDCRNCNECTIRTWL